MNFPQTRMRRTRMKKFSRDLCRENNISKSNLILPVFVRPGTQGAEEIGSMPGVFRHDSNSLLKICESALNIGIPAVAVFPIVQGSQKSASASSAWDASGLVPTIVRSIKKNFPELGVITDIALDPYTLDGQDGLCNNLGEVDNDATIAALIKQSLCHAEAGTDIIAPSDMMDGRIGEIRKSLEQMRFTNVMILSYAAKYSSSFYGPFREAINSKSSLGISDKHSYQMDPANVSEAMREVALDVSEGADIVMVKPGLPYLDIISKIRDRFDCPVFAYNVSGEYSMIKAAAQNGWLDERKVVMEAMLSFKRAGASGIFTYHALDVAKWLT
ncbi:MAG: porphobilinogen synthase [Proteobacteria bacterium]|nr:porphobilinogen synthase [Pseudomonadota bacterium]